MKNQPYFFTPQPMATHLKNLSSYNAEGLSATGMNFGIVMAEWNEKVTGALLEGAISALTDLGCPEHQVTIIRVPGTYELPLAAQWLANDKKPDAVICLGCVIQGETRHFDFICDATANGIMELNLKFNIPFIFGVLTPDTLEQAMDRAGGKHGNKGIEAAVTAVKMVTLKNSLK